MKCQNCGGLLPDDSTFCIHCGSVIEVSAGGTQAPEIEGELPEGGIQTSANEDESPASGAQAQMPANDLEPIEGGIQTPANVVGDGAGKAGKTADEDGKGGPSRAVLIACGVGAAVVLIAVVAAALLLGGRPAKCSVQFETGGGSAVPEVQVDEGSLVTSPPDPTREGYEFGGWYLDSGRTVEASFPLTVTEDTVLYAEWEEEWAFNPPWSDAEELIIRDSVDDYSWQELSQISQLISNAGSESEAVDIATSYNLCDSDGTLDGSQVKEVEFVNGVQGEVMIVGFWHDEKSDGSGKAGITFMFKDAETSHEINSADTNLGGWEFSEARSWLNSSWMSYLPVDLQEAIVPVDKLTNNVGPADSESAVTVTSDELWLFSGRELSGYVDWYVRDGMDPDCDDVLNAEGEQYKLFRDTYVVSDSPNPILQRVDWSGQKTYWWERSAGPAGDTDFRSVLQKGDPGSQGSGASNEYGIIPGFCV